MLRDPISFLAFLGNLGGWEIFLIIFLALLLFGGKKLPGLARDLGQGIREFRRSLFGSPEEEATQSIPGESHTATPALPQPQEKEVSPPKKKAKAKKAKSQTRKNK